MRRTLLSLSAIALIGALPATARAATLTLEGDTYVLTGTPGPDRFRTNIDDAGRFRIGGAALGAALPDGCIEDPWDNDAHCLVRGGGLRIDAGAGNDTVQIELGTPVALRVTAYGGEGDDELTGWDGDSVFDGGPGNDKVSGGAGIDTVLGGPGDDLVVGDGFTAASPDVVDGGPGYDTSLLDWTNPTQGAPNPPATVSLDGLANDGRPGEGDNVTSVERIKISHAATLIAGGEAVDFEIPSNAGTVTAKLIGSPGADRLKAAHGHDELDGGAGDDAIEGGYGNDVITGGPGRDTINADASGGCDIFVCNAPVGNDTVHARDGEADSIDCGIGTDRAIVDGVDTTSGCETVDVGGATPPGGGPPAGGGAPEPGHQACTVPQVKRGTKLSTARTRLRRAGCRTRVVKVRSRVVRTGRVVRLSRKRGATVGAGRTVTIVVSKGHR